MCIEQQSNTKNSIAAVDENEHNSGFKTLFKQLTGTGSPQLPEIALVAFLKTQSLASMIERAQTVHNAPLQNEIDSFSDAHDMDTYTCSWRAILLYIVSSMSPASVIISTNLLTTAWVAILVYILYQILIPMMFYPSAIPSKPLLDNLLQFSAILVMFGPGIYLFFWVLRDVYQERRQRRKRQLQRDIQQDNAILTVYRHLLMPSEQLLVEPSEASDDVDSQLHCPKHLQKQFKSSDKSRDRSSSNSSSSFETAAYNSQNSTEEEKVDNLIADESFSSFEMYSFSSLSESSSTSELS
jgi:hypothetical protein